MLRKKLLNRLSRTTKAALAVGFVALAGVTVWAAVTLSNQADEDKRPTLRFRCMDFQLIEDGSIQARVRLSVENVPKFSATGFNVKFNPYYIQPAYLDAADGETRQVLTEDGSEGKHFEADPALAWIKTIDNEYLSPLVSAPSGGYQGQYQINYVQQGKLDDQGEVSTLGQLSMYFELDNDLLKGKYPKSRKYGTDEVTYDLVQVMDIFGDREWESDNFQGDFLYIDASGTVDAQGLDNYEPVEEPSGDEHKVGRGTPGNGVNLGSITFKVNPDHLTEMVTNYGKFGASGAGAIDLHEFLLGYRNGEETDENNAWFIADYIIPRANSDEYVTNKRTPSFRHGIASAGTQGEEDEARVVIDFIFPKVLVKAEVAGGKDLTVNAYQAYGVGTAADIAATVQRYRPEITATLADATATNYIMDWGDTTPTATERGGGYKVYRPYDPATDSSVPEEERYIDRDHRDTPEDDTGWWVPLEEGEYDPKGGEYMVTQYFWYEENGETKMFPQPMEVHLTVTPVALVDVAAERLTGTYSQTEAGSFATSDLAALKLPNEAVLSLSPMPGPIVLTMPITTWEPKSIGALTTGNGQSQDWNAEGIYRLAGPDAATIKNYTERTYPWVTVDGFDKSIMATRTVVADDVYRDLQYSAKWVSTTFTTATELRLQVTKKVAGRNENFVSDPGAGLPKFRTYLPNGLLIDAGSELPLRASGSGTQTANGAYSENMLSDADATLCYVPGTAPRSDHQENVSRAINLGGWFYVSVCEELKDGAEVWSELIPVYVPPRVNYYIGQPGKDYYSLGDGAVDEHYFFDFTGLRAGLYPFYSDSVLPTNVVLPVGYTIGTTYDGFTGAEPGEVGQFAVNEWASAEEGDPSHTGPLWDSSDLSADPQKPVIINYGDPTDPSKPTDLMDHAYGYYGPVENHSGADHVDNGLEQVRVRVQAPEYTVPPESTEEPEPTPGPVSSPEEKIRLIHEDTVYTADNISGISRTSDGEVAETTYTLKSEGYIQRETFTLTIVNEGDTDIYGLSVNTVSGDHQPEYTEEIDHHFEVLVPPAAYLPAGGKTTFVVTYANNLPDLDASEDHTLYEDHILITSNSHGVGDPLKEYIANFEVSGSAVYRVTLEVRPDPTADQDNDGVADFPDMGTAKLVTGPAPDANPVLPGGTMPGDSVLIQESAPDAERPSSSGAGNTYTAGHKYVWVEPEPYDEYKVKSVYYIDGYDSEENEQRVDLYVYEWRDEGKTTDDAADSTLYFFEMPAKDVTVVVEYYEPVFAKLRLSRLMGYVGLESEGENDTVPDRSFLSEGKRHNVRWYDDTAKIIQTDPNYTEMENGDTIYVMTPEDSSRPKRPDYVIVLGDYANESNDGRDVDAMERVALRLRLRRNTLSPNIDDVKVEFKNYDLDTEGSTALNTDPEGKTWHETVGAPSYHNSYIFQAPPKSADGSATRTAVKITLSCAVTPGMIAEDPSLKDKAEAARDFVVVIVRPAATATSVLNCGNSPKGMIYNNTLISNAAKATAWANFKNNDYSFSGMNNRPNRTMGDVPMNNTYWKEAWGGIPYAGSDPDATNYDEDKYALFLILGQPFQDPGFETLLDTAGFNVSPEKIRRSVEVELLDTSVSATQVQRFSGARTDGQINKAVLDLGTGDTGLVASSISGDVINDWWKAAESGADVAVRPGVYTLTYSFPDYDGEYDADGNMIDPIEVTRPVIILAPVGDVNADRSVDSMDSAYIQNRVKDPLGGMGNTPGGALLDYPAWRLFRYRGCDTNNDRNINNIDANQIIRGGTMVPYYKPTDYVSK